MVAEKVFLVTGTMLKIGDPAFGCQVFLAKANNFAGVINNRLIFWAEKGMQET
ncbi:hypothetical protein HNR65_002900 [Desulfosalsimonas propionicica]|uniref:Uncharacterized protein n=1 Tax=Desulfosalsimonas propionicica TaxID=332175 RepID=A0A7W0CBB0_9BACT|nr:hypothetical protein [Desulfosalsimonas propionicica]MBA2882548.1 hypothetical protein [Desulfosalsimonas propionicica]